MSSFNLLRSLLAFAAFIGLAVAPNAAFAQHGGSGHGGGGGGSSHSSGGSYGSARPSGGGSGYHGGGFRGSRSGGGFGPSRGMMGRSGESEAGRSFRSEGNRSSNVRPAIADGQWHSFGNSGSSARLGEGRNSAGLTNSGLSARNAGSPDGGWHSFGSSRGAASGFSRGGDGWRGGRGGDGWRGGWHGDHWRGGWGWDHGWGWGWGVGFGWPYCCGYWAPGWTFGADPWLYDPYGYAYPDYYGYDWSDNPPPYRPDTSDNYDSPGDYLSPTSST